MITLRRSRDRGRTRLDWLDSRHSFSFGGYRDADWSGFGPLLVLNDDRVAPGAGFPTHPHAEMEILSWVLEGALEHRDSTGSGSVLRPGGIQRMSAGTGILHSEWNPSPTESVRFLQVWIRPGRPGLSPSWEERRFDDEDLAGGLRVVAAPGGPRGSADLHQDAEVLVARLAPDQAVEHPLAPGRRAWLHVARGVVTANGRGLEEGDGLAASGEEALRVESRTDSELLLFDLP